MIALMFLILSNRKLLISADKPDFLYSCQETLPQVINYGHLIYSGSNLSNCSKTKIIVSQPINLTLVDYDNHSLIINATDSLWLRNCTLSLVVLELQAQFNLTISDS
jgi:hypothetical protein